jgi:uncharacterized protein (DUF1810 family)
MTTFTLADPTDHRFTGALERFYDGRLDEQSVALLTGR